MIRLDNINVTFGKNTALEKKLFSSFNLQIAENEFVNIIGNNGAGKSTLLRLLAGSLKADSGKIYVDEEDITDQSIDKRATFIARVFQDPKLGTCSDLSIAENMSLAFSRGKIRNLNFALDKINLEFFKDRLSELGMGLENRINEKVNSLSGGQRQALSLLMATLSPAKLLLLDEHTAALDPKIAELIMKLTAKLYKQYNLTILMITHNIKHAFTYGNRTIMLQEGKILRDLKEEDRIKLDLAELLSIY